MSKIFIKETSSGADEKKIITLNSASSGLAESVPTMTSSVLQRADLVSGTGSHFPRIKGSELSFPACRPTYM